MENDIEDTDETDAGSTGPADLAKRIMAKVIFSKAKGNWKKLQQEQDLTFKLLAQEVRVVVRYAISSYESLWDRKHSSEREALRYPSSVILILMSPQLQFTCYEPAIAVHLYLRAAS